MARSNPLTRFVRGATRLLRRSAGFDIGSGGDRWSASTSLFSPVSQELAASGIGANRAASLAVNTPVGASYINACVDSIAGTGPTLRSGHPDADMRKAIEKKWACFAKCCDGEGRGDLAAYLAKLVKNLVITGDSFSVFTVVSGRLKLRVCPERSCWIA